MFLFDPKWKTWAWVLIAIVFLVLVGVLCTSVYLANVESRLWFVLTGIDAWLIYKFVGYIGD